MRSVISFSINKTDKEVFEASMIALGYNRENRSLRGKEWQSEVILACLERRLDSSDYVNVEGYSVRCEHYSNLQKFSREVNFINDDEWEQGYKGITESTFSKGSRFNKKTEVDLLIEQLDKEMIIAEFNEFASEVAIVDGKNIRTLLRNALTTGYKRYINPIIFLIKKYQKEELFETVLNSRKLMDALDILDEDYELRAVIGGDDRNEAGYETLGRRKYIVDVDERDKRVV